MVITMGGKNYERLFFNKNINLFNFFIKQLDKLLSKTLNLKAFKQFNFNFIKVSL